MLSSLSLLCSHFPRHALIFAFAGNSALFDHGSLACLMNSHCLSVLQGSRLHSGSLCTSHPHTQSGGALAIQLWKRVFSRIQHKGQAMRL